MTNALLSFTTGKRVVVSMVVFLIGGSALFQLGPYAVKEAAGGANRRAVSVSLLQRVWQ